MKKILLPFDGIHFSNGAFDFARRLNLLSPILLTGLFVPQTSYANLWSYSAALNGPSMVPLVEEDEARAFERNINKFEVLCADNRIRYKVHKNVFDFALPELQKETRFADLMIISSEKFYEDTGLNEANDYLQDTLHASEVPTILVPEQFSFPCRNILAYDGTEDSVFAIKQFAYLLPEFSGHETLLVHVTERKENNIPEMAEIEELASRHFPKLTIQKVYLDHEGEFPKWLESKKSSILVAGSYGRGSVSRMFRKSFVSKLIGQHKMPVFLAHK